ncbi:MAG: aminotransferase class I/II-fold pyridoxal phosphate-dependent enzyme [Oceanihabitans sp.]
MLPKKLQQKIEYRKEQNTFRELGVPNNLIDFSSNDYLGLSKNETIFNAAHQFLIANKIKENGATGSRLLTGNHKLYQLVEQQLCAFHNSEAALVYNSGFMANLGFFASIPQRGDVIIYDTYCHASIRDGIKLANAKSYKFKHNDLEDLNLQLQRFASSLEKEAVIYVVTESVFSMDGDSPKLKELVALTQKHQAHLIVDEAHAVGVKGLNGAGIISELQLENKIFARIITFGKAMGCHGAAILGSKKLKAFLINFSRPFIYTTALPPHALATINCVYTELNNPTKDTIHTLHKNILFFKAELIKLKLQEYFIESDAAIQCCVIPGNKNVKTIANKLQQNGFNVKPILSPTVPEGEERLRFCIHSYNTEKEITKVLQLLTTFVKL